MAIYRSTVIDGFSRKLYVPTLLDKTQNLVKALLASLATNRNFKRFFMSDYKGSEIRDRYL